MLCVCTASSASGSLTKRQQLGRNHVELFAVGIQPLLAKGVIAPGESPANAVPHPPVVLKPGAKGRVVEGGARSRL